MPATKTLLSLVTGPALLGLAAPRIAAADDGAKAFAEVCTSCHSADKRPLDDKPRTRAEWKQAIDRMVDELGAEVPKKQIEPLLDYLVRTYPPEGAKKPAGK